MTDTKIIDILIKALYDAPSHTMSRTEFVNMQQPYRVEYQFLKVRERLNEFCEELGQSNQFQLKEEWRIKLKPFNGSYQKYVDSQINWWSKNEYTHLKWLIGTILAIAALVIAALKIH